MKYLKIAASPTLWCLIGASLGGYQGYNHGFRTGVSLMAQATLAIINSADEPEEPIQLKPPAKRRI